MARSSKKIGRLVELFHNLETAERAKVGELTRQMSELRSSQVQILESLADPSPTQDAFLPLMSRTIGNIERRLQRLSKEHETAVRRYAEAAARSRGARLLLDDVRTEEARKTE
ncbi:MAG: hypothetical protein ABUL43_01475, partial [Hyphomicrobium sp.]